MKNVCIVLFVILLAGCMTAPPEVIFVELERLAYNTDALEIGMSRQAVVNLWGEPEDSNKTTTASGMREQMVYPCADNESLYVYIEGGKVTAWQE